MYTPDIETIRDAITNRRQLTFWANDLYRVVCPHILGTKEGEWHMLAWQINDESETGFGLGAQRWRCFELEDMTDVTVQDGDWHRGWSTGRGRQHCVDVIDTIVDQAHAAEVRHTSRVRTR